MPAMKISVLLPTRNRLDYLRLAVESVRRQQDEDWEIVVSDNCSEDDVAGYVASLGDPRIVFSRFDHPVPVTDNWNRALSLARGQYLVMLGDDDALRPGYMARMRTLLREFEEPDLVYTGADLFTYPGVDPDHPDGYLMPFGHAAILQRGRVPYVLEASEALGLVRSTMEFVVSFGFNMQFALFSRNLVDRLAPHGPFFQSEFPDYYAMNASFLSARRIVVEPSPQVVIGVTPKSYGFFYVNQREEEGSQFLRADRVPIPPGSHINRGWLDAVEHLQEHFGDRFGFEVDRRRYRRLQCQAVYEQFRLGRIDRKGVAAFAGELPPAERILFRLACLVTVDPDRARRLLRPLRPLRPLLPEPRRQFTAWRPPKVTGPWRTIIEAMDATGAPDVDATP
jgi:glycosyltransferase involved in cell wall biosynthesis